MINVDPKVARIIDWRESFVTLPDNHFFDIIRMYLGEVPSPFNKQKLVEQLGAFLHKSENVKTILNLLSESDLLILSAVYFIPKASSEKLAGFFEGSLNFASLYERLLNLEERLLIYRHSDKTTKKQIFSLNPSLEDVLIPLLNRQILLPLPVAVSFNDEVKPVLSPERIAAFANFISMTPALCKADGSIKKRDGEKIEQIFGAGTLQFFQYLTTAFINLQLLKECASGYQVDRQRLEAFASLDERLQYAYLCVASQAFLSRTGLVKQARLLLNVINSVPQEGYTRTSLLRSSFLIQEAEVSGEGPGQGTDRFAAMLRDAQATENKNQGTSDNPLSVMDRLLDSAETFGLLDVRGRDEKGAKIYVKGNLLKNLENAPSLETRKNLKVLNIDAGFNAMIFPGLPLSSLLQLVSFMDIKKFDTAAVFEITKKSVMRFFDLGFKGADLYQLVKQFSSYEIPENLVVSVDDWSSSYSSVSLFKGYILKIHQSQTVIVKNNPAIAPYINEELAPGIFLLSVQTDEEAEAIIRNSGLDFIGSIQTAKKEVSGPVFPIFEPERPEIQTASETAVTSITVSTEEERKAHFENLRAQLDKIKVTPEQREGLLLRINRKIILTPQQLIADSVKQEQIEASGMDFQGKIHVAESAITQRMMLELEYEDKNGEEGIAVIVGTPTGVEKNSMDAAVHLVVEPDHEERTFSLGQARNVKRIRGSVILR